MHFSPGKRDDFLRIFESSKAAIRAFTGCHGVELLQDINDDHRFFTYSQWESEAFLNQYRASTLFQNTWAATKALFDEKPLAWSTQSIHKLD
jgi:quinol monooxygenase YgiN